MSQAHRHANKKNAQRSTGPKTDAGKAASSQNSLRHGLSGGNFRLLEGENPQEFLDLANGLLRDHQPASVTESELVTAMAQSLWRGKRACRLQDELLESNSPDKELFALYLRYQTTHNRSFSQALKDFLKLRQSREKEARQRESGFVSQTQKQELHTVRIRNVNTRTEAHQAVVDYRKVRNARYFAAGSTEPAVSDAPSAV